jgi:hypothetical protein
MTMKYTLSLFAIVLTVSGCVTYHRYSSTPHQWESSHGRVRFSVWPGIRNLGQIEREPDADGGGSLWDLTIDYEPLRLRRVDLRLQVDSVRVVLPSLNDIRQLNQEVDTTYYYGDAIRLVIGPISLPKGYRTDFELSFVLSVYNRNDSSLVERQPFTLVLNYYKDREFYWGR